MSELRQRKGATKLIKEIDAFTKVPETYQEKSLSGAGIFFLTFIVILVLIVFEIIYYNSSKIVYNYEVDSTLDSKLAINVDLTVAMPCPIIGADVVDQGDSGVPILGALEETPVSFDLTDSEIHHLRVQQQMNKYLRDQYHSLHHLLFTAGYTRESFFRADLPNGKDDRPKNACRLNGTMIVSRLAGNLHIIAGKPIRVIPKMHMHVGPILSEKDYNFSHRISHLSFGHPAPGLIFPLDGDEQITNSSLQMYQYFIQVIPTKVQTRHTNSETFQFSVTQQARAIAHSQGSHGTPGIFIKYDLSPIKVNISEDNMPLWELIVKLCAICGGIFATSGIVVSSLNFLADCVCCRLAMGKYQRLHSSEEDQSPVSASPSGSLIQPLS